MDRKKILILILALVILIAGSFFIVTGMSKKTQPVTPPVPTPVAQKKAPEQTQPPVNTATEINPTPATTQDSDAPATDIDGILEAIDEKTLTLKTQTGSITANIKSTTPVISLKGGAGSAKGQIADLKVGEAIRINYNKTTKEAMLIFLTGAAK